MESSIDALVISPHPDDAEIGVGGTLALLNESGKKTAILDLTDGEPTPHGSPEIRQTEAAKAAEILGISKRINLGLPNRELTDSIEARKQVATVIRELRPEILFIPYGEDAHPDHVAAFNLGVAARFYAKLVKSDLKGEPWFPKKVYFYFGFHLRTKVVPSFIVSIDLHMVTKINAIRAYHSQFVAHKNNQSVVDDIEADNRYWGSRIYTSYGEPFVSREQIGVRSIQGLFEF